jgi:hypothetical protein
MSRRARINRLVDRPGRDRDSKRENIFHGPHVRAHRIE